jgi:predicted Zn-dependent protease
LSELELAVQLAPDNPVLRLNYAFRLVEAAKEDDAITQLRKATEVEPYYAAPYNLLGRILDAHDKSSDAIEQYNKFLAHASQRDPQYDWTKQRIALLTTTVAKAPGGQK